MITYRPTMPDDLRPLVVLDASGRVRDAYGSIERHWGILTRLRPAVKDYSPLTIHTWQTSGSKSGFEKNGDNLTAGIAKAILTKPDEKWLVVMPMIYFFGKGLAGPLYPGTIPIAQMGPSQLWITYIRPMGAGAVAASGPAS